MIGFGIFPIKFWLWTHKMKRNILSLTSIWKKRWKSGDHIFPLYIRSIRSLCFSLIMLKAVTFYKKKSFKKVNEKNKNKQWKIKKNKK